MLEARLRRLPRYVERIELTYQKGPAYRLPEGPCLSPACAIMPLGFWWTCNSLIRISDKKCMILGLLS